jgi:alpha-L-fucosidase
MGTMRKRKNQVAARSTLLLALALSAPWPAAAQAPTGAAPAAAPVAGPVPTPSGGPPLSPDELAKQEARMKWWRQARFGMFIHWGVYAVPAGTYKGQQIAGIGEWIQLRGKIPVGEYRDYAKQFNPVKYNPESWAALAQQAGMKYVVITSKHHDGFALYDSKVSEWDVGQASPYKKDLLTPLARAVRKRGLKFGLYYSQAQDWTHPGGAKRGYADGDGWDDAHKGKFDEYLRQIAVPQTEEILTRFKPDILWWDTPYLMTPERAALLYPMVKARPMLITNNRLGGGYKGDSDTPEQYIPATGIPGRDWEVCMTMNDTWGFKSYDENWKTTEDLIRKLSDIVSKGGNFLLNVGPTAEGEIPAPSIERLQQVGRWMKVNNEAIYGTTASPFTKLAWGRATTKLRKDGGTLYLHVFDWPADGKLVVPGLRSKIKSAVVLASKKKVTAQAGDEATVLQLPGAAPDPIASIIKVELGSALDVVKIWPRQADNGSVSLTAMDADIHNVLGTDARVESKRGPAFIGNWGDARAWVGWKFRIDRPGKFDVTAELAAEAPAQLQLAVAGQKLTAAVAATGGADRYQPVKLGQVQIAAPGEHDIELRPDSKAWKAVNLRVVTLTPATTTAAVTPGAK